jgi:peptidoglycan/LPS O-acetylase OafA/YrhL
MAISAGVRRDIQFLRGIAVLLVVLFHADIGFFEHGYLGVDVFFVISGFLITSIILRDLDSGRFSFSGFYLRRAKRLLPALYSTLAITALLAYSFLTYSERDDFIAQLIGSLTFSANMVLPTQLGYFEDAADGKLLLHIWSLSLEEQYYFFLPLVLFLIPKWSRFWALMLLTVASFMWCMIWVSNSGSLPPFLWRFSDADISEWAFYLFPTRAWELLAGSLCAWIMLYRSVTCPAILKGILLLIILLVSSIGLDSVHPRGDAIIVVLATSFILLGRGDEWLRNWPVVNFVEKAGDWSYSIYLVHWPLFACAYLGYVGLVPLEVKLLLVPSSILLGFLQYHLVETPFRHGWASTPSRTGVQFALATLLVILLPAPMVLGEDGDKISERYTEIRKANYGFSEKCEEWGGGSTVVTECMKSKSPKIAIWGDSFAMHLVPGLAISNQGLIQLTKSSCGPIVNLAPIYGQYDPLWAKRCIEFNRGALQKILGTDSIRFVVLSSTFRQYFSSEVEGKFFVGEDVVPKEPSVAASALLLTIEQLKAAGKIPILFSPPPRSGFNIGECLERKATKQVLLRSDCDVLVSDYLAYEKEIREKLKQLAYKVDIKIVWLDEMLCDGNECKSKIDDTFVYRDSRHLSVSGSKALLGQFVIQ